MTEPRGADLALIGALLTPRREIPRGLLRVSQGRIASVEPWQGEAPHGASEIDGYVTPGFIDLQVNGFAGQDFGDPKADLATASRALASHGVTSFLPTLITAPLERYLERLAQLAGPLPAAQPLGVHLEGPYLSPRFRGAHPPGLLRRPDLREVERLLAAGPPRMITLAPELAGSLEVIRLLARRGIVASIGHSNASFAQTLTALDAGALAGTHLFNAMRPFHHREPGVAGALLADRRATAGLIADGIHVHPAAIRLAYLAKGAARLALVTDAVSAAGMSDGAYPLSSLTLHARGREARLPDGTLAGSVLTMDAAVRNAVSFAGCTLREAVTMATSTPARLLGLADKGVLRPGAHADLVLLDSALRVQRTYVAGRLVFSID